MVVCEGAGSPAEINLRAGDYVNARAGPAVRPADGGGRRHRPGRGVRRALRHLRAAGGGRPEADHRFVINKFRGDLGGAGPGAGRADPADRDPGRRRAALAARPLAGRRGHPGESAPGAALGIDRLTRLRVAVVRLPRVSNVTDVDALAAEPGVEVRGHHRPRPGGRRRPGRAARVPGHGERPGLAAGPRTGRGARRPGAPGRAGAGDLRRLPDAGRARSPTRWSPGAGLEPGLGLLPVRVSFAADKVLGRPAGALARAPGHRVRDPPRGGRDRRSRPSRSWTAAGSGRCGARCGTARFENDEFRRAWLAEIADVAGSAWRPRLRTHPRTATGGRP